MSGLKNPFLQEYLHRTLRSMALFQKSQTRLPGGNTRAAVFFHPHPTYVKSGKGARIIDIDGNELIDFHNNYSALILGHANSKVIEAVKNRVGEGVSFGAPTEYEYELADLVSKRKPSIRLMRFCNSGTESTMYSLLVAKAFTKRKKILKFEGAYHGTHEYALVSTHPPLDWNRMPEGYPDAEGVSPSVLESVLVAPFNDIESTRRIFNMHRNDIAAIIVEPVMGAAGMIPARKDFLKSLREMTESNDSLLIFDEVITGFRLALGGAQEYYGISPDLTALGKNLGGGFPVGGYGGREDIMEFFNIVKGPKISLSGTFSANPVTMAAGLATLQQLTPEIYEKLERNGKTLQTELEKMSVDYRVPCRVTRASSLLNVHFTDMEVVDYRSAKSEKQELKSAFFLGMLVKGILMATRGMAAISEPMGDVEIDSFAKRAGETFDVIQKLR